MRTATAALTVAALLGILAAPIAAGDPGPFSPVQEAWGKMFNTILWMAVLVGVLVWVLLVYALIRFRAKKGGPADGPHIHGNTKLEVAWTIAPAIVMAWLLIISYNGLFWIEEHPDEETDFVVTIEAFRFGWNAVYPDGSRSTNGTLRVEQNAVVEVDVVSKDVIHAFSVHELTVMVDAVPGRTNHAWFKALVPGEYEIKCRELCGVGHSFMRGRVIVFEEGSEGDRHWGWPPPPPKPSPSPSPTPTATGTNNTTAPADEGRAIDIRLGPNNRLVIDPVEISDVEKGETITFKVTNADDVLPHNLYVGAFDQGADKHGAEWTTDTLESGESATLTVKFEDDATYEYWCDITGHRTGPGQGMSGTLTVGAGGGDVGGQKPLLPGFEAGLLVACLAVAAIAVRRRR